uniref:Uncharacterized protein n=1 Tax=Anopheles atroparvus TaxID=41427 RepID=A0A182J5G5_ANOAO
MRSSKRHHLESCGIIITIITIADWGVIMMGRQLAWSSPTGLDSTRGWRKTDCEQVLMELTNRPGRRRRRLGSLEATLPREMVSRRKILSRSRDDLNLDQSYITQEEEEDVWYQKEKLYKAAFDYANNR